MSQSRPPSPRTTSTRVPFQSDSRSACQSDSESSCDASAAGATIDVAGTPSPSRLAPVPGPGAAARRPAGQAASAGRAAKKRSTALALTNTTNAVGQGDPCLAHRHGSGADTISISGNASPAGPRRDQLLDPAGGLGARPGDDQARQRHPAQDPASARSADCGAAVRSGALVERVARVPTASASAAAAPSAHRRLRRERSSAAGEDRRRRPAPRRAAAIRRPPHGVGGDRHAAAAAERPRHGPFGSTASAVGRCSVRVARQLAQSRASCPRAPRYPARPGPRPAASARARSTRGCAGAGPAD